MAYKATGIMPDRLANEIELPRSVAHVWGYFCNLHSERASNGIGLSRITSTAIKDWCFVTRTKLEPWEVKAIKHIDNLWMESIND